MASATKSDTPTNGETTVRSTITPDDFAGNIRNAIAFESHRDFNKIGQPVDHGEWDLTPPTVDADYNPQLNDINFPAGVLQPPLYDAKNG